MSRRAALRLGVGAGLGSLLSAPRLAWATPHSCGDVPTEPLPFPLPWPSAAPSPRRAGSRATVHGSAYRYVFTLDGQPVTVRGMGYNPRFAGLGLAERRAVLERDFGMMRASSVNTVIGWDPAGFDDLTLDVAAEAELGVILPYDVDFRLDFRRPGVARAVEDEVLEWVARYREHPAVWMWGIGNEVLHRMVPPAWCATQPDAESAERARAFAATVVRIVDQVHRLDPHHPVVCRDAEDAHVGWIAEALCAQPAARSWLVYGVNAYTTRLDEILAAWPSRGLDAALLVSEFGPLGAEHGNRAAPLRALWSIVRSQPSYVIGGAVYVWYTEGPEEVDRQFGLVDLAGRPVDDALAAIAEAYTDDRDGLAETEP